MKIKQKAKKQARIEMIPLIDVVFLLLVFFIYSMLSMVVHRGIPIDLPQAKSSLIDKKEYIALSITKEGTVFWGKRLVTFGELKNLLAKKKASNPHLKVFIKGDRKTHYEKVVRILDIVRLTGLNKVSLETVFEDNV
ncbi:MAG: biopolymer transporter ExbD [Thermodesulfobacteriota bacterium]|nr:biopolymer transporter ExbD [Thermodesulfobacteriota bacterium]